MQNFLKMPFQILFLGMGALPLLSQSAHAHPSMIRHGYRNCIACHQSVNGGGLLTDYGKSVGLYSSEDKTTSKNGTSEREKLKLLEILNFGFQGRVLFTKRTRQSSDFFVMQADLQNKTKLLQRSETEFYALATVGLRPNRLGSFGGIGPRRVWDRLVARQALLGAHFETLNLRTQIGRDFLPVGIYTDDHTLYYRKKLKRGVDDYATIVRGDLFLESMDLTLFGFGPSFEEKIANREWGGGLRAEASLTEFQSLGLLIQGSRSPIIGRQTAELFSRVGLGSQYENWGLLFSGSFTRRSIYGKDSGHFNQVLVYLAPFFSWKEWLEVQMVSEWFRTQKPFTSRGHQWGPSLKLRPLIRTFPNLAVLMDYRFEKTPSDRVSLFAAQAVVRF